MLFIHGKHFYNDSKTREKITMPNTVEITQLSTFYSKVKSFIFILEFIRSYNDQIKQCFLLYRVCFVIVMKKQWFPHDITMFSFVYFDEELNIFDWNFITKSLFWIINLKIRLNCWYVHDAPCVSIECNKIKKNKLKCLT